MKKQIEVLVCDMCEKPTLNEEDIYQCIHCGKDICGSVDCCYEINVTVYHNIPNGIPFLRTQARYRICKECHVLNGSICKELHELLSPKKNVKFYRRADRDEPGEWVKIK